MYYNKICDVSCANCLISYSNKFFIKELHLRRFEITRLGLTMIESIKCITFDQTLQELKGGGWGSVHRFLPLSFMPLIQ